MQMKHFELKISLNSMPHKPTIRTKTPLEMKFRLKKVQSLAADVWRTSTLSLQTQTVTHNGGGASVMIQTMFVHCVALLCCFCFTLFQSEMGL